MRPVAGIGQTGGGSAIARFPAIRIHDADPIHGPSRHAFKHHAVKALVVAGHVVSVMAHAQDNHGQGGRSAGEQQDRAERGEPARPFSG